MTAARFSIIRAVKPPKLSKSFRLENGELVSRAAANMIEGVAVRRSVEDVADLARLFGLLSARRDWALCSGITDYEKVRAVTKAELAHVEGEAVARARTHFHFPDGPGLLCLDYDPVGDALAAEELHTEFLSACPWLEGVGVLITESATSHIYAGSTCLKGPGGHHTYLLIEAACDVPKAVEALFQDTFAKHGYCMITKSGARLPRTLIDRCSPQPERLLFECGAILADGLIQRRPSPRVVPGERLNRVPWHKSFETWKASDPVWLRLRDEAADEAAATRELWIAERLASGKVSRETLERALINGILADDFEVTAPDGKSKRTVGHIRAHMALFIGQQIPDPLEPDYRDGSLCAVIKKWGILSLAHGGYSLRWSRS